MLKLSDYFQPLNFKILILAVLLFVFFDIIGTGVSGLLFKKKEETSRILSWLIGFGIFIFIWFIAGIFIPPISRNILISIIIILFIFTPSYLRKKKYLSLFKEIDPLKVPLLIIALFLPAVFIKASLPPYYWDEMAYQFISPSTLQAIGKWNFNGDIYGDLPRTLNTFFILIFSLTKTYSLARLFHFAILATSMLYAYRNLRKNFGFWVGFLFVFIFFSIPQDIIFTSTLGYVDVAAYSFLLIGLLGMIDYFITHNPDSITLSVIFWSLSLGTKYSSLTAFVPSLLLFIAILILQQQKKLLRPKLIFLWLVASIIFGGFWYLKNFILFANPLSPFYLPCKGAASSICPFNSAYFDGWTYKIILENARPIIGSLFNKGYMIYLTILVTPVLIFYNRNKKSFYLSIFLIGSVILEFIILKFTSGFMIRYHQHIQLYLLLLVVIQLTNFYKVNWVKRSAGYLYLALGLSAVVIMALTVRSTNSLQFLRWNEINYAVGKTNIYDWVKERFPNVIGAITWCENPPEGKPMPLAQLDPDMIWYKDDCLMRIFMTNCYYENPPLNGIPLENVLTEAKNQKLQFYNATPNKCVEEKDIQPFSKNEKASVMQMRKLNNLLLCNSKEVSPGLYYFDYLNLAD